MPNPHKQGELIKPGKARVIFNDIKKSYLDQYQSTWNQSLIPLEFFVTEFCKRTGQDMDQVLSVFNEYFDEVQRRLYNID